MQYKDFVAHDDNKSLLAMNGRMEESEKRKVEREIDCVKPYPIFYHYIYYDTFAAVLPIPQMNFNIILRFERRNYLDQSIKYTLFSILVIADSNSSSSTNNEK